MRPQAQSQLLTACLDDFYAAVEDSNAQPAMIGLWYQYFLKILQSLLLSAGPQALELLAVRNIASWTQKLSEPELGRSRDVAGWFGVLLNRTVIYSILAVLYNRLPKPLLHGIVGGSVGPILKAFLGPDAAQPKGTELTASLIK